MEIRELSDQDFAVRLKETALKDGVYSNEFSRYANELFNRYHQQGYNIARYYGLKHDDAMDSVQSAFIKTFHSIKRYDPGRPLKPWFFKIVLNCVRDKFKELRRTRHEKIDKAENFTKEIFEEFHIRESINGIISILPEKLKSVVLLRVYGDMDFDSISLIVGVSVRQLHNRLKEAYGMIEKKLNEGDG
ncbi:MAG: hypothetical protein A2Y33_13770 [Spirochaetes bacterium GWF1_51_8]|nr:MAG: hypothetical protein A2Y33_13770 [Spirochaetes bacterium GWF1_51_8]